MTEGKTPYIDMNDKDALDQAKANIEAYDGVMRTGASHRSFLDIEDRISVRTPFQREDYYRFRDGERPPTEDKKIIQSCMSAYENVGIIKNIIDLMGDFGSQGISLVHTNKNEQKFYRRWWELVDGSERSERFLNTIFRCGNVIINRRFAKLTRGVQKQITRGEEDVIITKENVSRRRIPFVYNFFNPMTIEVDNAPASLFLGNQSYKIKISQKLKKLKGTPQLKGLPKELQEAITNGDDYLNLDPDNTLAYHYKKDDWQVWAHPMVNAILDDITMLEKMKLADMSALDGAISNIRVWTLGDLEHKILPTKASITKLRDVLASNVGGGTMDLVWGPEIHFTESNTQIYKFLGTEKYQPVLNSIYAGLGIPPTLTGITGQSGGYTNNFISLKTLIERLEYGREMLRQFWGHEIRLVQKAMKFNTPAKIHFEHMILSDEAAEKNLLIQLADRDIISSQTLQERFGEISDIESSRLKSERSSRNSSRVPPKAGPYHNPHIEDDFNKIALNKDQITIDQVTDLKPKPTPKEENPAPETTNPTDTKTNDSETPDGGRPLNKKDTKPRKQRTPKPRSKPGVASILLWSTNAQKTISHIITPAILDHYKKTSMRALTKAESDQAEKLKFTILLGLEPFEEIDQATVLKICESQPSLKDFNVLESVNELVADFISKNSKNPSLEEMRQIYCFVYSIKKTVV